ncbi:MAG: translocation/assembly module TamB [Deltaproteobacteria bacterium]|nr:translocation/assembly module TamB [Deltaproteobacteria bacterium]
MDVTLDQGAVKMTAFRLRGDDSSLAFTGSVDVLSGTLGLHVEGGTDLGVLQAFSRNVRSAGRAAVTVDVGGTFERPLIAGFADLTEGRLRSMLMPHAVERINGRVQFDGRHIRVDDIRARVARGDVRFGGRIGLEGFAPSTVDLTASGEGMEFRYPEGFRSVLDADLALRGPLSQPVLSGTVQVRDATLKRRLDLGSGMLELGTAAAGAAASGSPAGGPAGFPLRFDVRILAPQALEIDNNLARITSSADLRLAGTYDKPLLFGRAEVDRGEVWFEGKRIVVTRGNIDFTNPARIEPSFDVEAETRVRAPGQTYRVTIRVLGTMQRMTLDLSSDPPLPQVDIVTLLLGDAGSTQDPELRALQNPNIAEQSLIQARAARLLASPIASNVGRVVERTFGVDTFQITPMLTDPSQQSGRFLPGARLMILKRISDRVYLTYSRSLTSSIGDQVILLEYDQNDRLSWVVTQNEDRTYAIDVRVRHIF